jgi:hypothetical protein
MTDSIAAVNRLACDVFEREGNGCGYEGAYMPHMSLIYGDLDKETKEKAMEEVAKKVIGKAFNFGSLQLWSTEGLHTEWKCVKTVTLPLPYQVSFGGAKADAEELRASENLKEYQNGTMTRADIMQWATARKALISAHRAGMKQLRGAREYVREHREGWARAQRKR